MFQFTTTTVINSKLDSSGKKRWNYVEPTDSDSNDGSFNVLRVGNFEQANVEAVYIGEPVEGVNESVSINFAKIASELEKNDQLTLSLYVGLTQASLDSRYSNDLIFKGKPFTVEFIWKGDSASTLAALEKTINKYQVLVYGDKQLEVNVEGEVLTIIAKTEYQRFKKVELSKYDPDNTQYPYSGQNTVLADLEDTDIITLTDGKESFGTYEYILHNLRLPTFERTRPFGVHEDEVPAVGAKYFQVTIHYCKRRGPLGTNAVGDLVTSKTTHVFYVHESVVTDFVASMVGGLNLDIEGIELPNDSDDKVYEVGDINKDGVIDVADLNALLDILIKRGSQGSPKKISRKA